MRGSDVGGRQGIALAENLQEAGQGWILIVLAPVRGIADAGRLGAIPHLAINQVQR